MRRLLFGCISGNSKQSAKGYNGNLEDNSSPERRSTEKELGSSKSEGRGYSTVTEKNSTIQKDSPSRMEKRERLTKQKEKEEMRKKMVEEELERHWDDVCFHDEECRREIEHYVSWRYPELQPTPPRKSHDDGKLPDSQSTST